MQSLHYKSKIAAYFENKIFKISCNFSQHPFIFFFFSIAHLFLQSFIYYLMSTIETEDLRGLRWVQYVGWSADLPGLNLFERGSGATDAAESLITDRLRGMLMRADSETQEGQTWQKATIWHYLLSSCLFPLHQRRSTAQTAGQTWCFTHMFSAAAPVCFQEHVRCASVLPLCWTVAAVFQHHAHLPAWCNE